MLVLGIVLAAVFLPRPESSASDLDADSGAVTSAAGELSPASEAGPPPLVLELDPVLEAEVREIIREATSCVIQRTSGKVAARL